MRTFMKCDLSNQPTDYICVKNNKLGCSVSKKAPNVMFRGNFFKAYKI